MNTLRFLCAICGFFMLIISTSSYAAIVTIDFNNAIQGSLFTGDYFEDGFTMQNTTGHYHILDSGGTDNSQYLGLDTLSSGPATSDVRFTGAINFSLLSFDTFNWFPLSSELLTVTSSAGGFIEINTTATHVFSAPVWKNLNWINFSSNASIFGPGFDTLTLDTSVPIPASVWLLGTGIISLLSLVRKSKQAR